LFRPPEVIFIIWKADMPPELDLEDERHRDEEAARAFIRVCADGDAQWLSGVSRWLDEGVNSWKLAMAGVARLRSVSAEVRAAFVPIWIEHKTLPRKVDSRRIMARALRVLMPGGYSGPPLTLYRGAEADERRRRIYGFSWSTDIAKARPFAEHWARTFGTSAVVLRTAVALPEAVLLVRQPGTFSITTDGEEHPFDEDEVVVDPFRLGRVDVAERLKEVNPCRP
jgi:hypothetical protein